MYSLVIQVDCFSIIVKYFSSFKNTKTIPTCDIEDIIV